MGKILVIAGVPTWSMNRVCRGVQAHSKHDLEITNYWMSGYEPSDWDAVYIHCGAAVNGDRKKYIQDHREDTKWAVGLRGGTAFIRNINRLNSIIWDAYSVGSPFWLEKAQDWVKSPVDIPGFVCHGGIDTSVFTPRPFPDEFSIGWAGNSANGAKRIYRFNELPFKRKAIGGGAMRKFKAMGLPNIEYIPTVKYPFMNDFYGGISLYVQTSYREGGSLPPKEAAASGRPVVTTRVGDAPEWIPEEYLVETARKSYDEKKMIELITMFKEDPDLLEREGKRFKELSKQWDFSIVAKEYDLMFDVMLE
jgi:glycosyltransferase involved in cell wall biosynthesis